MLINPNYSAPLSLAKINESVDPQKNLNMNVQYIFFRRHNFMLRNDVRLIQEILI